MADSSSPPEQLLPARAACRARPRRPPPLLYIDDVCSHGKVFVIAIEIFPWVHASSSFITNPGIPRRSRTAAPAGGGRAGRAGSDLRRGSAGGRAIRGASNCPELHPGVDRQVAGAAQKKAKPNHTTPHHTKPNQTKPNQTKPNQTTPHREKTPSGEKFEPPRKSKKKIRAAQILSLSRAGKRQRGPARV